MQKAVQQQNTDNQFLKKSYKVFGLQHTDLSLKLKKQYLKDYLNQQVQYFENIQEGEQPDKIIEESRLKTIAKMEQRPQKHKKLRSQSVSRVKIKDLKAQKMVSDRFSTYKNKMMREIDSLQVICNKNFGGLQLINQEMNKNAMTREEMMQYCLKLLPKNIDISKIGMRNKIEKQDKDINLPKIRSLSQKNIRLPLNQPHKQVTKFNKWFIDPSKRFSFQKQKTKYDWKSSNGIMNVIRTQELKIPGKPIQNFIEEIKIKYNRQPLFCKYTKLT